MQQHFGGMQRNKEKQGIGNRKKYKKCSRKIKQLRFTNEFIDTFLESSSDEDEQCYLICNCEIELELYYEPSQTSKIFFL